MARFLAALLAIVLASFADAPPVLAQAAAVAARKDFDTPEAAIAHYVTAVSVGDFDLAMQALAVDEISRFDFAGEARYLMMMNPVTMKAPATHRMYVQMNRIRVTADFAQGTKLFMYGLLTDLPLDVAPIKMVSEDDILAFLKAVDPARLKPLKIIRIDQPRKSLMKKPAAAEMNRKHAALYGADELTERIALLELGGQHHWAGYRLLRYGKAWRIQEFHSNFAGPLPQNVVVGRTTTAEYDARLK